MSRRIFLPLFSRLPPVVRHSSATCRVCSCNFCSDLMMNPHFPPISPPFRPHFPPFHPHFPPFPPISPPSPQVGRGGVTGFGEVEGGGETRGLDGPIGLAVVELGGPVMGREGGSGWGWGCEGPKRSSGPLSPEGCSAACVQLKEMFGTREGLQICPPPFFSTPIFVSIDVPHIGAAHTLFTGMHRAIPWQSSGGWQSHNPRPKSNKHSHAPHHLGGGACVSGRRPLPPPSPFAPGPPHPHRR